MQEQNSRQFHVAFPKGYSFVIFMTDMPDMCLIAQLILYADDNTGFVRTWFYPYFMTLYAAVLAQAALAFTLRLTAALPRQNFCVKGFCSRIPSECAI
jgi:hypothetical protein